MKVKSCCLLNGPHKVTAAGREDAPTHTPASQWTGPNQPGSPGVLDTGQKSTTALVSLRFCSGTNLETS